MSATPRQELAQLVARAGVLLELGLRGTNQRLAARVIAVTLDQRTAKRPLDQRVGLGVGVGTECMGPLERRERALGRPELELDVSLLHQRFAQVRTVAA